MFQTSLRHKDKYKINTTEQMDSMHNNTTQNIWMYTQQKKFELPHQKATTSSQHRTIVFVLYQEYMKPLDA